MPMVTVSPNFQIEIPTEVWEKLTLQPSEALNLYIRDGEIRLSRPGSIRELRGMCKGVKWDDYCDRDHEDRF